MFRRSRLRSSNRKMYQDQPPSYSEAINSPNTPTAPPALGFGIAQSSNAVPSYPVQDPPEVVISKPIQPLPTNYQPLPHQYQPIGYGTITQQPTVNVIPTEIIVINGCPACRIGVLEDDYTCLGICCAIFLFPVGVLCCLALKNKRCTNCGAQF